MSLDDDISTVEKFADHDPDLEAVQLDYTTSTSRGLLTPSSSGPHRRRRSLRLLLRRISPPRLLRHLLCYPSPTTLHVTSWLDGVRGIAALLVYIFHLTGPWLSLVPAWHANAFNTSILQLPLLRTVFVSGGPAVCLFFVLSGYVLSHRSLSRIRHNPSTCSEIPKSVFSSFLRRPFRLFLPIVALTFCEMIATRFGIAPPLNFTFVPEPTAVLQFTDWIRETNALLNPWYNYDCALLRGCHAHPKYDQVIWTIPIEFYGSVMVYTLLLLFSLTRNKVGNRARMGLLVAISGMGMWVGAWHVCCFAAGMVLADFNLHQEASSTPLKLSKRKKAFWWLVFAFSFYTAGFPSLQAWDAKLNPMPGFTLLRYYTPFSLNLEDPARFWWSISAILLLVSFSQLPALKRIFETGFCQYLGKISFSLYLVHQFWMSLFGLKMKGWMMGMVGLDGFGVKQEGVVYVGTAVVWWLAFTLCVGVVAARVERWVDRPSVGAARWFEGGVMGALKRVR